MISNAKKLVGPQAGSAKYDVLTAIAMIGLHRGPAYQSTALRLITVVTARYNWRLDELSMGQRDMARIWGVSERTAKRDVKMWMTERWAILKRPGVRGRAGAYRLDLVEIGRQARELWPLVGQDFANRLGAAEPKENVIRPDFNKLGTRPQAETGTWEAISSRLKDVDQDLHEAWFAPLSVEALDADYLTLRAPSKFVASYISTHLTDVLANAVTAEMGPSIRVIVRPN